MKNIFFPSAKLLLVERLRTQLLGLSVGVAIALTAAVWPSTNSVVASYMSATDGSTNKKGRSIANDTLPINQGIEGSESSPRCEWQNPKTDPGRISWHHNLGEACAASRKSGKPVFLFQMMGRLDQEFC